MLTIRLQRVGKKNQASFRIVLAEKHRSAKKKVLEVLGFYNPRTKEFGIKSEDRLKYWVSQNVEISPSVRNLLIDKKLLAMQKVRVWKPKKKEAKATEAPKAAQAKEEIKQANVPEIPNDKIQMSNQAPNPNA